MSRKKLIALLVRQGLAERIGRRRLLADAVAEAAVRTVPLEVRAEALLVNVEVGLQSFVGRVRAQMHVWQDPWRIVGVGSISRDRGVSVVEIDVVEVGRLPQAGAMGERRMRALWI